MDRYLSTLSSGAQKRVVELHELHITGITCMFIASKYEDVYPLLLKTVFNKIGHQKITTESIREKEIEILRALGFKIGAPTQLEFLEKYILNVLNDHSDKAFIRLMSIYLSKLSLHHINLCSKNSNLMGVCSIYVALKICEQMR